LQVRLDPQQDRIVSRQNFVGVKKKKTTLLRLLLTLPLLAGSSGLSHGAAARLVLESLQDSGVEVSEVVMDEILRDVNSLAELCQAASEAGGEMQTAVGCGLADAYCCLLSSGDRDGAQRIVELVASYELTGGDMIQAFVARLQDAA
jgi:hypothetical protein